MEEREPEKKKKDKDREKEKKHKDKEHKKSHSSREEKSEDQQTDRPQHPRAPHVRGLMDPRILAPVGGAPGPQFVSDPVRAGVGAVPSASRTATGPR